MTVMGETRSGGGGDGAPSHVQPQQLIFHSVRKTRHIPTAVGEIAKFHDCEGRMRICCPLGLNKMNLFDRNVGMQLKYFLSDKDEYCQLDSN